MCINFLCCLSVYIEYKNWPKLAPMSDCLPVCLLALILPSFLSSFCSLYILSWYFTCLFGTLLIRCYFMFFFLFLSFWGFAFLPVFFFLPVFLLSLLSPFLFRSVFSFFVCVLLACFFSFLFSSSPVLTVSVVRVLRKCTLTSVSVFYVSGLRSVGVAHFMEFRTPNYLPGGSHLSDRQSTF